MSNNSFTQHLNAEISNQDIRILLWDIDGTILQSTIQGSFKKYFSAALEKVYGTHGKIFELNAAGITDTQIAFKALEDEGFTVEDIINKLDEFQISIGNEMKSYIAENENVYEILPGVREILETTSNNPCYFSSLLTGNVASGAEIKLSYVDVWQYFQGLPHAYGDISHDRRELGKVAEKKINEFLGFNLKPEQFIIIGDTPNDIFAARAFGAKVISVGTGRGIAHQKLIEQKPDVFLEDLTNIDEVLHIISTI